MQAWLPQKLSVNKNQIGPYTGSVRQLLCDDPRCVICDKVAKEVMQRRMTKQRGYIRGRVKPLFQSMEEQTPLTIPIRTAKADSQLSGTRKLKKTSIRPPTPGLFDSKTTLGFQGNLQDHIMQKSIGMRLEGFPVKVENSQWMNNVEERNTHLPKLIPLGHSYPQLRNRLCLNLQGKANLIEVNIRCKQLHFLWGLPSIHMQSLDKLVPSPPVWPSALPSQVHTSVEFGHAEPSFIAPREREILESHVLKKRLHHDWGLPGLVQQSLKQFLLPVPASSTHLNTTAGALIEVQVVISRCQIPFAPLETREHLEAHLRRKIVERWWDQPRRVLDSLRVFSPPPIKSCKEDRRPFMLPLEGAVKKRVPPLMIQSFSKNLTVSSREHHQHLCWDWKQKALQGHLAKKVLEIQLGSVAQLAQQPWEMTHCVLPKVLPPEAKPLQPRCQQLLFVDQTVLDRITLNLVHKQLVYQWGLPTIYNRSLAQLLQGTVLPATVGTILPSKDHQFSFSAQETPFLGQASRDLLEWHVKSKSLQHTWGLPGLIQRSLQYLQPDAGCVSPQKAKGRGEVVFCLTELSFIRKATQALLEKNVRQRVIHQRWMLPKRVLESLRMLFPPNQLSLSTIPQLWTEGTMSGQQGRTKKAKGMRGASVPQLLPALQDRCTVRLKLHLAKKCLEVQLETFPPLVALSHKCPTLMSQQPLPKVPLSGSRPLHHRTPFLPFVPAEEATRMEVCVQRCYLSSLWGLGQRYVEALSAMAPGPHSKPFQHNRAPFEFFHMDIPFLHLEDQNFLEQHVSKKRLQHEWGLPRTVQSSLTAFVQCFPPEHAFHRSKNHIQVLQQEVLFLTQDTYSFLESHIRRMKLQQQWGLPRRVLNSLKLLFPEAESGSFLEGRRIQSVRSIPWESSFEGLHPQPWALGTLSAERERRKTRRMEGAAIHQTRLGLTLRTEGTLRHHFTKKALEVHLGCFPVIPTASFQCWSFTPRQPLLKPIHPGVRPLRARIPSLSLSLEEMGQIELALKRRRLASLWGLGTKYVETRAWMGAPRFSSLQPGRANFQFMGTETPFLQGPSREVLEQHVRKKKVQHEWGLPFLVQRSLQGFMEESPMLPHPSKTLTQIYIMSQEALFLSRSILQHLDVHIQRMKLQCRWGLPQRILKSAKHFLPLAPSGGALSPQRVKTKIAPGAEFGIGEAHVHHATTGERKHPHESCLQHKICFHSKEDEDSRSLVQSREGPTEEVKKNIQQKTQVTTTQSGSEVVTLASPERKPSFLTEKAWNLLEFHIAQKKIQHAWSLPSSVVRSLNHFSPFPEPPERETGESIDKTSVWHQIKVKPTHQNLFFLSSKTMECLEAHVSSMATKRRWEIPKRVQHSLRGFMALRPPSQSELDPSQPLSLGQCESFQVATDDSQTEDDKEDSWEEVRSKKMSRRKQDVQRTQGTTRPASLKASAFLWPEVNLLFLSAEAQDFLELHIRHKQIQHAWGLPSNVLKSLHVFSPFLLESYAGQNMVKMQPQERVGVQIVTQSLPFFPANLKEHLNAHLRQKIAEHRWGLPERVQQSLRTFLPPRAPSQPEVNPSQPLFYCQCKSFHVATDGFWPKENKTESLREVKKKKKAPEKPGSKLDDEGEAARTSLLAVDGTASSSEKAGLPFLTDKAANLLEFHIQQKKIQHAWGLPSKVIQSLHVFSPFLIMSQKHTGQSKAKMHLQEREVQIMTPSLSSLNPDTQEHLRVHLRHMIAEHRWGLPERVQQSLKAFLPPRATTLVVDQETNSVYSELMLPFLTDEVQNYLEFHIQHKKIQHAWGLPTAVLKSLHAFAPFPLDSQNHPPVWRGNISAQKVPQVRGEVHITEQLLSFLSPQTKKCLEAHMRSITAEHRWGLPKRVRETLIAFQPSSPPFWSGEAGLQDSTSHPVSGNSEQMLRDKREAPEGKSLGESFLVNSEMAQLASSAVQLPFLADAAHRLLEFHIQRKKIQHEWGLPATVQRSMHAFAPMPLEPPKSPWSATGVSDIPGGRWKGPTAEKRKGATKAPAASEVKVASEHLDFVPQSTQEELEGHVQNLTLEHKWRLPKLLHESLKAFNPQAEEMEEEDKGEDEEEQTFIYHRHPASILSDASFQMYTEKEWNSSSEEVHSDDSESFHDTSQDSGKSSWLDTEKAGCCPGPKVQQAIGNRGVRGTWESGRGVCGLRVSQNMVKRTGQRPSLSLSVSRSNKSRFKSKGIREMEQSHVIPTCSCHLSASRKDSVSCLPTDAEPLWRWQQREEVKGKAKWNTSSSSLQSEHPSSQNSSSSPAESMKGSSLPEQEASWSYPSRPFEVQQYMDSIYQEHMVVVLRPSLHVESHSSYEDIVSRKYRQAGRQKCAKPHSQLHRRGSRLSWGMKRAKELPQQTLGDTTFDSAAASPASSTAGELGECSCESIAGQSHYLKTPPVLKGTEDSITGKLVQQGMQGQETSSEDSGNLEQRYQEASASADSQNCVDVECDDFQTHPTLSCLPQANEDREKRGEDDGKFFLEEEQLHSSSALFLWNRDDKGFGASDWLRKKRKNDKDMEELDGSETESLRCRENAEPRKKRGRGHGGKIADKDGEVKLSGGAKHDESTFLCGRPMEKEALGTKQTVSKISEEDEDLPQFLSHAGPIDEMVSLIGGILERKLGLQDGYRVWKKCHEIPCLEVKASETCLERKEECFCGDVQEHKVCPQFLSGANPVDEKVSITGGIMEKKLNLQDGHKIWKKCHEIPPLEVKTAGTSLESKDECLCGDVREHKLCSRFLGGENPVDEKVSLIGEILERKLNLQDGYKIWKKSYEVPGLEIKASGICLGNKEECSCGDIREHKLCPQFLGGAHPVDEKISLIGEILERKLNLKDGYKIWKKCHEIPRLEVKAAGTSLESRDECLCGDVWEYSHGHQLLRGEHPIEEKVQITGGILNKLKLHSIWKKSHEVPCLKVKASGTLLECKEECLCKDFQDHKHRPQILGGSRTVEKVSIIGGFLKKLNFPRIWKKSHQVPRPKAKASGNL